MWVEKGQPVKFESRLPDDPDYLDQQNCRPKKGKCVLKALSILEGSMSMCLTVLLVLAAG